MTDRALLNALQRRDELASKINMYNQRLEWARKQLVEVDKFIADWHRYADDPALNSATTGNASSDPGSNQGELGVDTFGREQDSARISDPDDLVEQNTARRLNPTREEVGRHATAIISGGMKPVPRSDLFKGLQARGVHIYGKDPEMVLSTMMWRMQDQFVRLPKLGYWLRNEPYEPARYWPGDPVASLPEDPEELRREIDKRVDSARGEAEAFAQGGEPRRE